MEEEMRRVAAAGQRAGTSAQSLWGPVVAAFTRLFLRDVHDFLYVAEQRERMVKVLCDRLTSGGGPFVVIGHSQGSMIAYEALTRLAGEVEVPLWVTIGSPLGLAAVQERLRQWHGSLRVPRGVGRWLNVAGDGDLVCAGGALADAYRSVGKAVEELRIKGMVWPPAAAHDSGRYLGFPAIRRAVLAAVDRGRFQPVGAFTVTRDLVRAMDERADERHPVLIELVDRPVARAAVAAPGLLDGARAAVLRWIEENVVAAGTDADRIGLEVLDQYVAAKLTRREVECLAARLSWHGVKDPAVYRVFRNHVKRALMRDSCQTIQALPAQRGYGARGQGITCLWTG